MGNYAPAYTRQLEAAAQRDVERDEEPNPAEPENEEASIVQENSNRDLYLGLQYLLNRRGDLEGEDLSNNSSNNAFGIQPPQIKRMRAIKAPFRLNKQSLQLIARPDKDCYDLQFSFDTAEHVSCVTVQIYYAAKENLDKETKTATYTSEINLPPSVITCKGFRQIFGSSSDQVLDIKNFPDEDLIAKDGYYPVVIQLKLTDDEQQDIVKHTTLATLLKCADGTFEIKPLKQKIEHKGISYTVHEIFGTDETRDKPEECVICISENRNTLVIPCRHLCLCHQCAEVLRFQSSKCPICRGPVRSLLRVQVSQSKKETSPKKTKGSEEELESKSGQD
eukprot:TRINITY_DN4005_c0_g1_i1.p1 TRINITY_DN4005_c0_g1~~TRINITY_DN4005_c0_g1_i1.p1  ORF type:complete len:335 (+),score=74.97 TRINITY_DN4005_c0_g1_i1:1-1005(+)